VRVPSHTWKVITVLDAVGQGPADVNAGTRVIAVIMPNDDTQIPMSAEWRNYRVTTRAVEQRSGLNFMSAVPQSIQDVVETALDTDSNFCNGF
jgi:endonuclease G